MARLSHLPHVSGEPQASPAKHSTEARPPLVRRIARACAVPAAALLLIAAGLATVLWSIVRPAPGEWTETVRWGRWQRDVSMPTLLRMATHPFTLELLQGRRIDTGFGPVRWAADAKPGTWHITCAPCAFERRELGHERIVLPRVVVTLERDLQMKLHGTFVLGDAPNAVHGRWNARVEADGMTLKFELPDTPLAHTFALFGSAVPEAARAQIDGTIGLTARLRLPARELTLKPRIEGFRVAGLGTEALLGARPACGADRTAGTLGASFGVWLPRAVIAAEDQRFHDHAGYDLTEIVAAWSGNARAARSEDGDRSDPGEPHDAGVVRPRGASTLSQQLAKLLYTGDRTSPARKLRELLYAVELDRTLGKARVLDLYLSIAPWGDGACGAQAAALHLLGKPAPALTPLEAAWLASLLRNPNAALAHLARGGGVDERRVAGILTAMRPMAAARRAAALEELPQWRPAVFGAAGAGWAIPKPAGHNSAGSATTAAPTPRLAPPPAPAPAPAATATADTAAAPDATSAFAAH
jgi:hypothetical protein